MDEFINIIEEDPLVCIKINNMLDKYKRLSYDYKNEIAYDNMIHKIILKELIKMMSTMIFDLDMELKLKISRIKYLESR